MGGLLQLQSTARSPRWADPIRAALGKNRCQCVTCVLRPYTAPTSLPSTNSNPQVAWLPRPWPRNFSPRCVQLRRHGSAVQPRGRRVGQRSAHAVCAGARIGSTRRVVRIACDWYIDEVQARLSNLPRPSLVELVVEDDLVAQRRGHAYLHCPLAHHFKIEPRPILTRS